MLATRFKLTVNRALEPLAMRLVRSGVSPTLLTLTGAVGSALVCLIFLRTRAVIPFCLAMAVVGSLDALDGAVARAGGCVTRVGAYLDALCDRYVEAMVVGSVAYVTGTWALSMAVVVGALLVSYAKARAAMETSVSNQEWPDFMERMERDVIYIVGLWQSQIIPWRPFGRDVFWWTLTILAVLVHVTVVQRIFRASRYILQRAR